MLLLPRRRLVFASPLPPEEVGARLRRELAPWRTLRMSWGEPRQYEGRLRGSRLFRAEIGRLHEFLSAVAQAGVQPSQARR